MRETIDVPLPLAAGCPHKARQHHLGAASRHHVGNYMHYAHGLDVITCFGLASTRSWQRCQGNGRTSGTTGDRIGVFELSQAG